MLTKDLVQNNFVSKIIPFPPRVENVDYRISSYSFRGNYSFFDFETQRSQYIRSKVTVHKCAETIQGRKLFKGGNYMRKYGIQIPIGISVEKDADPIIISTLKSRFD